MGRTTEFFVAQISQSAVSPNCIRQAAEIGGLADLRTACGLKIRDTAGCNPALQGEEFCPAPDAMFDRI